jgi:hypothetical protein
MKLAIENKFSAEPRVIQGKPQYQSFEYLILNLELSKSAMTTLCTIKESSEATLMPGSSIRRPNPNLSSPILSKVTLDSLTKKSLRH